MNQVRNKVLSMTAAGAVVAMVAAGCGGGARQAMHPVFPERSLDPEMIFQKPEPPRKLKMYSTVERTPLLWEDVVNGMLWAELVIVQADPTDPVAASVTEAIVQDALTPWPWTRLSLAELDRGDQQAADDFVAGRTETAAFKATAGIALPYWETARTPLMNAARSAKAPLLAGALPDALAARVSETEGYKALTKDKETRGLMSMPRTDGPQTAARLADATMATSLIEALRGSNPRVLHITTADSNLEGLIAEVVARRATRVMRVAVVPGRGDLLAVEDYGRGDLVIYTGVAPE